MAAAAIITQRKQRHKFLKRMNTMNIDELVGVMEDNETKKIATKVTIEYNKYQDPEL